MFLVFFMFLVAFIVLGLLWRFSSKRWQISCPFWLGWMVEQDNPLSTINRASSIVEKLNVQPGMAVLDAGCGPGRVTIPLAKKVGLQGSVIALDIQEEMLNRVKEKARVEGLSNITFLCAGLGEGKLQEAFCDRAILVTVLGEIPNQKEALQEVFNALKSGGMLSITEIIFDPHYQRITSMLDLAQSVGFEKKEIISDWFAYNLLLVKP